MGVLEKAGHREVDEVDFVPVILETKNDIGWLDISVDVAPIVKLLNCVEQLDRNLAYD